jgi:hypothetical protein
MKRVIEDGVERKLVYPAHSELGDARHLTQGDARGLACLGLRNAGSLGLRMIGEAVSSGFRPMGGEEAGEVSKIRLAARKGLLGGTGGGETAGRHA